MGLRTKSGLHIKINFVQKRVAMKRFYGCFCVPPFRKYNCLEALSILKIQKTGLIRRSFAQTISVKTFHRKGSDRMSELFCHANCVFQSGGRCGFKYSTACGMPSCRSNACVHYIPRSAVSGVTTSPAHAALHRHSAPPSASGRPDVQDGSHAALE